MYTKISGKQISHAQLNLYRSVICDFHWLTNTIEASDRVHMLDAIEWDASDADLIIYSDVSLNGLGFYAPDCHLGFCASMPADCLCPMIFYFEALAIALAILWTSGLTPPIHHMLIYTDSLNSVEMFNTLNAQDGYKDILLFTVHILMTCNISLCMFHIPGTDNVIADALSRHLPGSAVRLSLDLQIHHFQPPRTMLGCAE